jgi:hypothetical protein
MITTIGAIWNRQIQPSAAGLRALQALGVNNPEWGDWQKYATQVVQGFQGHPELSAGRRAALAKEIPGGDVLLQIAKQFSGTGELAKALEESATTTREQAEAARRLTEQFTQLQLAIEKAVNKLIPEVEPTATKAIKAVTAATKGDMTGLQQIDEDLGREALKGQQQIKNAIWDQFVRMVVKPEVQNKWLSGSDFIGPPNFQGPFQPMMTPETRNLPREGVKIHDRFPGLGPGVSSGSAGGAVDNSKSVHIDAVHVTVPPGTANPATFAQRFVGEVESQMGSR